MVSWQYQIFIISERRIYKSTAKNTPGIPSQIINAREAISKDMVVQRVSVLFRESFNDNILIRVTMNMGPPIATITGIIILNDVNIPENT